MLNTETLVPKAASMSRLKQKSQTAKQLFHLIGNIILLLKTHAKDGANFQIKRHRVVDMPWMSSITSSYKNLICRQPVTGTKSDNIIDRLRDS